jgi:hypothetical protein
MVWQLINFLFPANRLALPHPSGTLFRNALKVETAHERENRREVDAS